MPIDSSYRPSEAIYQLGDGFYDVVKAAEFPERKLRFRNHRWAARVGLEGLDATEWENHFARFAPLPGTLREPLALRYHGHQFGVYNAYLGDGRGFLHAQCKDSIDDRLLDLGTKGSGTTPWSRAGDGRLTLKGGVREVLATEMLEALGVRTSKSFSLYETGEPLIRNDEPSPTRSSVLVRLSHSHIRFGTFQRHAHRADRDRLEKLLRYSVAHYYPALTAQDPADLAVDFVRSVARESAAMCASWMIAGFVHGVLNTDNMNITGESFDYGPYRFLPTYDPLFVAAYFDESGLYAFGRQPERVHWNVTRLAEAFLDFAPASRFEAVLGEFEEHLVGAVQSRFLRRLGLISRGYDQEADLVDATFTFLKQSQISYDQFFFDWYGGSVSASRALGGVAAKHYASDTFRVVRQRLESYEASDPSRTSTAYFQRDVPCSLGIQEIESIWDAIDDHDDWSRFEAKISAIRAMGEATATTETPILVLQPSLLA